MTRSPVARTLKALAAFAAAATLAGCASETAGGADGVSTGGDALSAKADEHWVYNGTLPTLENATITVALKGHTARVTGYLPAGAPAPNVPHARLTPEGARTKIDLVYPIATARPGKSNSIPGVYALQYVKPYRPDGNAWTQEEGDHQVPWGGFPFFAYNNGIAFHGPITSQDNKSPIDQSVWYLERGTVSGGCNRMMGEHVVELTHVMGVNMRRIYNPDSAVTPSNRAPVTVVDDYDLWNGKYVDVDYPTAVGVVRPAKVVGADKVEMFGSWVATEAPDGSDLPPDMKWEGGVAGKPYVFAKHAVPNLVCSFPKDTHARLRELQRVRRNELPADLCAKKACYVDAIRAGRMAAQLDAACR
jgi:hypothetical protein